MESRAAHGTSVPRSFILHIKLLEYTETKKAWLGTVGGSLTDQQTRTIPKSSILVWPSHILEMHSPLLQPKRVSIGARDTNTLNCYHH